MHRTSSSIAAIKLHNSRIMLSWDGKDRTNTHGGRELECARNGNAASWDSKSIDAGRKKTSHCERDSYDRQRESGGKCDGSCDMNRICVRTV